MEKISRPRRAPFGNNPKVGDAGRATQQRILAAASTAFEELGYAATTVEAITDRAGCSRPTFYQYFSGKEDLHRRLAGRMGEELAARMAQLEPVGADADGRATLRTWLGGLADVYREHRPVAVNFTAAARTDELMVSGAADLSDRYRRAFADAMRPEADIDVTESLASAANAMAYGASAHREHVPSISPERLADGLADTLHRTFFGPRPEVNTSPRRPSRLRPPPPSPPEDTATGVRRTRGMETHRRLLAASYTTFSMLGFDATRVDDIAAEAGLSHGTFYRYFQDKEAAFRPLLREMTTELVELVSRLGPDSDFDAWAASYYELLSRRGGMVGVWLEATFAGIEPAVLARQELAASIGKALQRRDFGDAGADTVACLSLLEGVPGIHYTYGAVTAADAQHATAVILRRGLFGQAS